VFIPDVERLTIPNRELIESLKTCNELFLVTGAGESMIVFPRSPSDYRLDIATMHNQLPDVPVLVNYH
jgi:hypothetical protein